MPKSKVRAKAKRKITRERRNIQEEGSTCVQQCCPPSGPVPKTASAIVSNAHEGLVRFGQGR